MRSNSEAPTIGVSSAGSPAASGSPEDGRFPAGTVLAGRYRIIALLGRGGMGEVYRASDLKLGQPVALKFLPVATAGNQQALARFHAEVRIARQVSHPNVCRVYDIAEVDGSTFLSMEYVDGEDLGSLLRRIGRLPGDKATEIARKLCAGLAAAHDKGVLHRDLKPANVMIDGRGQVLITDFGLAAFAGQLDAAHVRDGTPAYMAPEQLAGEGLSVRSDVYSLGLVLYEMFTGKRAFENGSTRTTPTNVTSVAKDIDPLVERVILRCMDIDARNRPASALAVAAALPGGDPLAAALAAGDTPTPGMVAASGDTERISVRACGIWLALILVGLVGTVVLGARINPLRQTPFENSPDVLTRKSRDLILSFGYADVPNDHAYAFAQDMGYQEYARRDHNAEATRAQLAKGEPPLIHFWYRESPQPLAAFNSYYGIVSLNDPPPIKSGMVALRLDPQGRLLTFDAIPRQVEVKSDSSRLPDWPALFTAAGLDITRFTPAEPQWASLGSSDVRVAWTGSYARSPELPLRVEAASWRGRPVFFRTIGPWTQPDRMGQPFRPEGAGIRAILAVSLLVFGFAALVAWSHFRAGKGDIRGANRLAAFVFALEILEWLCTAHQVSSIEHEFTLLIGGVSGAGFVPGFVWVLYVALEPIVRRRWPQSMITWSRLLAGGFRDPLMSGHVVAGVAFGVGMSLCMWLGRLTLGHYGQLDPWFNPNTVLDVRRMTGDMLDGLISGIVQGQGCVFVIVVLRVLLRRQWLAAAVLVLVIALPGVTTGEPALYVTQAMIGGLIVAALHWFGVLSVIVAASVATIMSFPLTTDFSAWYAGTTISVLVVVLALTAYGFHRAVAGRPVFRAGFLEPN